MLFLFLATLMAAWGTDGTKPAAAGSIGDMFWCACHGDVKSDMEDVELESLWEDLLATTGNGFDDLSLDPIRKAMPRYSTIAKAPGRLADAALEASAGLLGARASSDDFSEEPPEAEDARREPSAKSPRMSTRIRCVAAAAAVFFCRDASARA